MSNSSNHQHNIQMVKGKGVSQKMAQAIALAAHEASMATVQGRADLSLVLTTLLEPECWVHPIAFKSG